MTLTELDCPHGFIVDEAHLHRRLARLHATVRRNAAGVKCSVLLGAPVRRRLSIRQLPYLHALVKTSGSEPFAIGAKRHAHNLTTVAFEGLDFFPG